MIRKEIKNILAIRTDRFGEFILTLPAIYALKESFPGSRLALIAHPYSAQLVCGNGIIDEVIEYEDSRCAGIMPTFRLIRKIKKSKYDLAVVFNPKKKFHIMTFLAGIPIRAGYDRKWGFLLNKKIEDLKSFGAKHEVGYNFDLVEAIGANSRHKTPRIYIDKKVEERALRLLAEQGIDHKSGFIVLHPWTSDPVKQWPVENFSQLADRLLREFPGRVAVIGGRDEAVRSESFCATVAGLVNLAGKFTLSESAAFLKTCRCLISNDSGPVHLAAAVGLPVAAIFRSGIPGKSAKRWGPWGGDHIVIEKDDLCEITVDEVLEKVHLILKSN